MAPSVCANRQCAKHVLPEDRSKDDARYCSDCGDLVYAFRPDSQQSEDWYLVSDGDVPYQGQWLRGGPCEVCYLNEFLVDVSKSGPLYYEAVCRGQFVDGERRVGCQTRHPIRMKPRYEVILRDPSAA